MAFYTEIMDQVAEDAIRALFRANRWRIFPYGWWIERNGCHVIFDRAYRPICRIHPSRKVDIVDPSEWIDFKTQRWFYRSYEHPMICPATRERILDVIARLQIEPEIRDRREREKKGTLPKFAFMPGSKQRKGKGR